MNFQLRIVNRLSTSLLIAGFASISALAQGSVYTNQKGTLPLATGSNLYCAGYIQSGEIDNKLQIVGAEKEGEREMYADGDVVYINSGSNNGVRVGDMYSVIRPRGKFSSKFSSKKNLGIYVEEAGALEVFDVKNSFALARVKSSCTEIMLGDILTRIPVRTSPKFEMRKPLDRFADATGRPTGSIVLARDGQEMLSAENIVYIDLGREDGVNVGDYLTVYRPLGTGNLVFSDLSDPEHGIDGGFQSDRYQGGKFSNQTGRKSGKDATGQVVTGDKARKNRPKGMRQVVGEMVILNVLEKTATAMIVRNAGEIHTGDNVEVK